MLNFSFSAALLAGGQSKRMGRDKASLLIGGEVLWKRQLAVLCQLSPMQLFICGRQGSVFEAAGCEVITDIMPDSGPLGGLVTALQHTSTEMLVILAVDMPAMKASFLATLLETAHRTSRSVIPQGPDGLEPLAAVYRKESIATADLCLRAGKRSMQSLITKLQEQQLADLYPLEESELPLFRNVNTPEELSALEGFLRERA